MRTIWDSGFYNDEEQDFTYINTDHLRDEDRLQLMHRIGFELVENQTKRHYRLEDIREGKRTIFNETFQSISEAFDWLKDSFHPTTYLFVTDQTYPETWKSAQEALQWLDELEARADARAREEEDEDEDEDDDNWDAWVRKSQE